MLMIDEEAWLVGARPTPSQHPGHDINVFTRKQSACTKPLIESTDRLKDRPAAGKISSLNQASRQKLSG